jgi:transposase
MLVHEVLSRRMRDQKAPARYAGLTGTQDKSGAKRRELGLAQSRQRPGLPRMIQLAWRFLLFQEGQRAGTVVPGPPLPIAVLAPARR